MSDRRRGEPAGVLDLRRLDLAPGAGTGTEVPVALADTTVGGQVYEPDPREMRARVDVASSGSGIGMRLRCATVLRGPCQRCLAGSSVAIAVDARDFQATGRDHEGEPDEDLDCEYLSGPMGMDLDVAAWARDAIAEAIPMSILCREDCAGLCVRCGADLNVAPCRCPHDAVDPRWSALGALRERLGDAGADAP